MNRKLAIASVAAGGALVTAASLWYSADGLHTVISGELYRSGQPDPARIEAIAARLDLKTVINLRGPGTNESGPVRAVAEHLRLTQYDIDLLSHRLPPVTELLKLIEVLQQAERPILVHCLSGVDRTGFASAVALLMRDQFGLNDAKWQTSLRYGVIKTDSIGKQFLAQYETWLSAGGRKHMPELFLRWVKDHYVDEMGNLRFYLDSINSTRVTQNASTRRRDGYAFQLDRNDFHEIGRAHV